MQIPIQGIEIHVTKHALQRFRERVQSAATVGTVLRYFRESEIRPGYEVWIRRFGLLQTLKFKGSMVVEFGHIFFLIECTEGKPGDISIVTVMTHQEETI